MSTLILVAATGSLSGVIGAAAMFIPAKLCRDDARTFMERGEETFGKAERLVAEHERTRDLPWHYADEHVTGEVLAVEHHEVPALSDQSHEDEQAAEENDDHEGWPHVLVALVWGLAEFVHEETPLGWLRLWWQAWQDRRASRDRLDGDETLLTDADFEEDEAFAIEVEAMREAERNTARAIAEEIAELTGEPVDVVIRRREGHRYLPTGAFPLVKVTGAEPGRHRAAEAENAPVEAVA